jgi:uncharacterized protein (TIGR00645 family)
MSERQPWITRLLSRSLFDARWLMAPFYLGLVVMLGLLLIVFAKQLFRGIASYGALSSSDAVLLALSLIDLSLIANLLLIVILAGYENFVARIESGSERRPSWMGTIDFSGMKMKLMGSIIAISAIAMLRIFMVLETGGTFDEHTLRWMIVIHTVLMLSILILAVSERIFSPLRRPPDTGNP